MSKGSSVHPEAIPPTPASPAGRRAVLAAGLGAGLGAAFALLPGLHGAAAAAAATPPKAPTEGDIEQLGAAQRLELSLRDVYDDAIGGVAGWNDEQAAVMVALRESHEEFANALSASLGTDAPGERSEVAYAELRNAAKGTPDEVLPKMWAVESRAVATHLAVLGALEGTDGAELTAAIIAAEARHCTVLADLAGIADPSLRLVDEEQPLVDSTK